MQDGRVLERKVERLSGWVGFPLTAEQRMRKFRSCAQRVLDDAAAERVVALVNELERLPDVRPIMDIVRA